MSKFFKKFLALFARKTSVNSITSDFYKKAAQLRALSEAKENEVQELNEQILAARQAQSDVTAESARALAVASNIDSLLGSFSKSV